MCANYWMFGNVIYYHQQSADCSCTCEHFCKVNSDLCKNVHTSNPSAPPHRHNPYHTHILSDILNGYCILPSTIFSCTEWCSSSIPFFHALAVYHCSGFYSYQYHSTILNASYFHGEDPHMAASKLDLDLSRNKSPCFYICRHLCNVRNWRDFPRR